MTFTRSPATVAQDQRAAEMRSRSMTYEQIGQNLGISRQAAFQAVRRAMADIIKEGRENTEEIVIRELEKLDFLERRFYTIIQKRHVVVTASGRVAVANGESIDDDGPAMAALNGLLKVSESRRKLLGLNAPTRTELTGKDGGAIEIENRSVEAKAAVLSLLGRLKDAG